MHSQLNRNYVGAAIDELVGVLGVKEEIPSETISPVTSGDVKVSLERMAGYLGLPVKFNIVWVPASYGTGDGRNTFQTSALVNTDETGRGTQSITAQVVIPGHLPFYGSGLLQGFPLTVKISDNCRECPKTFLAVMAHELSHVLLYSLHSLRKDNEVYTDLAAMISGFSTVIREGRKLVGITHGYSSITATTTTTTTTTTYGYLPDDLFDFAFDKISRIRAEKGSLRKELLSKLTNYEMRLSSCRKHLMEFKLCLGHLDRNPRRKVRKPDVGYIVQFHQPDYVGRLERLIAGHESELTKMHGLCSVIAHYTPRNLGILREANGTIDDWIDELRCESDLLLDNLVILRRNVGFLYRLKVRRTTRSAETGVGPPDSLSLST